MRHRKMKYHKPVQGDYESWLTPRLMYNIVNNLIKEHVTREDVKKLRSDPRMGLEKFWDKQPIRGELEEFVDSYFFTDLAAPLQGFEEIFKGDILTRREKFSSYMAQLEQQYGSKEEANKRITLPLSELKKRGDKLYGELLKINELKGVIPVIRSNTRDAFGTLSTIYGLVQLVMQEVGSQS